MISDFFKNKKKNNYVQVNQANTEFFDKELFFKCQHCSSILLKKDLENNLSVCPKCNYHYNFSVSKRLENILDNGSFTEFDSFLTSSNPLNFPEYEEKLQKDMKITNLKEAIITGEGKINNLPISIGIMDNSFRMGSMGSVVGEKIARLIENSLEKKIPCILFCSSGGARMQEGILSLMQMAKTSACLTKLHNEGVLYIPILTNPTTGGVSASFAMLGDIIIAEPNATIGFAGKRIIEQTIREKLPDDFQTSEFLLSKGQIDLIVERKNLKNTLTNLLKIHS